MENKKEEPKNDKNKKNEKKESKSKENNFDFYEVSAKEGKERILII